MRPRGFGASCKHGRLARSCDICDRDEEIDELKARVAELEKDAEELAARRYLDIWAHVNTGTVSVKFSGEQGEEEIWESSGYEADFTASSPQDLARKLGWKP